MKVAIIGAGASGLACLHEFERLGLRPDVFEQRSMPGETNPFVTATIDKFNRFMPEFFDTLKEKYDLEIKPINPFQELVMYSPSKKATVKGHLGWFIERGQSNKSISPQLSKQTKTPIQFNTLVKYKEIQNKYDHVVVANGNSSVAKELQLWKTGFRARIRLGTALGDFNQNRVDMWLNTEYAKTGYVYLAPFSKQVASLAMVVPEVGFDELNARWQHFIDDTKLPYDITERHDMDFESGLVTSFNKDNVYLIGNAGGMVDSLMGVGLQGSVMSGIFTAQAIAKGKNINKLLSRFSVELARLEKMRRALDRLDNAAFDKIVAAYQSKPLQHLVERTHFDVVWAGSLLSTLFLVKQDLE